MRTTVIIGNRSTRRIDAWLVTAGLRVNVAAQK